MPCGRRPSPVRRRPTNGTRDPDRLAPVIVPRETAAASTAPEVPERLPRSRPGDIAHPAVPGGLAQRRCSTGNIDRGDSAQTRQLITLSRPPGPRRAKFDRDEFDTGEVAEPPVPARTSHLPHRPPRPRCPNPQHSGVRGRQPEGRCRQDHDIGEPRGRLGARRPERPRPGSGSSGQRLHRAGNRSLPRSPGNYEVLNGGSPIADHLVASPEAPTLLVLPATIDLAGAEIQLVSMVARENRMRKASVRIWPIIRSTTCSWTVRRPWVSSP